jgi:uncharacterized protein
MDAAKARLSMEFVLVSANNPLTPISAEHSDPRSAAPLAEANANAVFTLVAAPAKQRAPALDLLRGIAVLGILLINIYSFALPEIMRLDPKWLPQATQWEHWYWYLLHFFADTKFIALLSMAFGAGLWLFAADKQALGEQELNRLQGRRSLWLLVFGLAHAYLLWEGDVLFSYALFSVVVWRWRHWGDRQLIVAALAIFGLQALMFGSIYFLPDAQWKEISSLQDGEALIAADTEQYLQNWWQQAPQRISGALGMQMLTIFGGWFPCVLMLCGMVLARRGYFSAQPPRNAGRLLWLSLVVGLILTGLTLMANRAQGFDSQYALTLGMQLQMLASAFMAIGYALLISWWSRSHLLPVLRRVLIAVGRMALSIYILQTLIFTGLFYGYGLGCYGQFSLSQLLLLILIVWLLLCAFALLWLRYCYLGPLEWLWRRLVYQRPLELIRRPG